MDIKIQQQLAANIRYLRHLFGYNQIEISEEIGLARCTYAQFESGIKKPTLETLLALSSFYGISVDTLLHLNGNQMENHIILLDRCRKQLPCRLDIYNHLSPEGQRQLRQTAEQLAAQEETGEMPGFSSML